MTDNAIELREVCKRFGELRAVDGISAAIPKGSIYGFLGPNGAGKTTTIRMIMNILRPDSGAITILGRPMEERTKRLIGYLPEERGLYKKMTVQGVLAFLGGIQGLERPTLERSIAHWLELVGLSGWAGRKVEELSKGMQQKIQFVATVLHDPELLILDEPFSGLDPVGLEVIRDLMLRMRAAGKTVIFSTHMMEQAERLCDAILLINRGRKVLDGPLDTILARGLSNVVALRVEGDASFIPSLPQVQRVEVVERRLEVTLEEGADSQELLRALVDRVRVTAFEEKTPTLHEIFIEAVGGATEDAEQTMSNVQC